MKPQHSITTTDSYFRPTVIKQMDPSQKEHYKTEMDYKANGPFSKRAL